MEMIEPDNRINDAVFAEATAMHLLFRCAIKPIPVSHPGESAKLAIGDSPTPRYGPACRVGRPRYSRLFRVRIQLR